MRALTPQQTALFWRQTSFDPQSGCWITAYQSTSGRAGQHRQTWGEAVHRIAYRLTRGGIPEGSVVRHKCDNPRCVNPTHLQLGTQADNMADMVARGRSAKGEHHSRAVYTEAQVREVKRLLGQGYTQAEITKRTGVERSTVYVIRAGKRWRHVA